MNSTEKIKECVRVYTDLISIGVNIESALKIAYSKDMAAKVIQDLKDIGERHDIRHDDYLPWVQPLKREN